MAYCKDLGLIGPLLEIMRQLRDPVTGCPWDRKQTLQSVIPYTIEEAYEVHDAVQRNAMSDLKEELGDLLLQVVFQAQIAEEQKEFDFADVVNAICEKMVRRHPHVFSFQKASSDPNIAHASWDEIKQQERELKQAKQDLSLMDRVETHIPPLQRSLKIQKVAAKVNFDWQCPEQVDAKLLEEIGELRDARNQNDDNRIEEEYGDLLFTLVNLGRHLRVSPEQSLYRANAKFEQRFRQMERIAREEGRSIDGLNEQEWDVLWRRVKGDDG